MQTTLLGLAVAIILALVTALVGPLCVDWGRWRASFEAEATRLVGMPVRVAGSIDARLLPTPSLLLNGIEIGDAGQQPKLRARTLAVEFALGSLMRGEWRASRLHLDAPELTLGIGADGRIEVPKVSIGFDPDQLSFDRVDVVNGRAVLVHAASDTRLVLDRLRFTGDMRSLLGPFKGEGAFVSSGRAFDYRIAGSRRAEDGGMRLRLHIDPSGQPLTIDSDGTFWAERNRPRFEGNVVLAHSTGGAPSSHAAVFNEAWRATGRVKATSVEALVEQLEIQYGPQDSAIRLTGTAEFRFGAKPSLDALLSARQLDLDRFLPDDTPRTPLALLRRLTDTLSDLGPTAVPLKVGIGIDNATLGGASVTALRGDLRAEDGAWSLDSLEFRAPGATQVRASGRLSLVPGALEFAGPASVDSADPRALITWLEGHSDSPRALMGALRARGDVTLGAKRVAVDGLRADIDRKSVEGRLAYIFATDRKPARLDAALNAADIDLDGAIAFARSALAGTGFDRPGEIALALSIGHASYAGIEAKGISANLALNADRLIIERLAATDFGGASLSARGRIDTGLPSPRGTIDVAVDAQRLAGLAALAARIVPDAQDVIQELSLRAPSAKLSAKLEVAPVAAAPKGRTSAKLKVEGTVADVRIKVSAEGIGEPAAISAADVRIDGQLDSENGASLARLIGADRLATIDQRAARFTVTASGRAQGDVHIDAKFSGAGLDAGARGSLRLVDARPRGKLDVTFAAADARLPRRNPGVAMPVAFGARVSMDGDRFYFDAVDGRIAGTKLKGQIMLAPGHPARLEGRIDADSLDAASLIALAIGSPVSVRNGASWSSEPFAPGAFADIDGQIDFSVARAAFGDGLFANRLRGTVRISPSAVMLDEIEGSLGDGRVAGRAEFRTASTGLSADARISLVNADLSAVMPRPAVGKALGRVSVRLNASGAGLSPAALVGALQGSGSITAENLQLANLDPNAIDAAALAAQRGVPVDAIRIGDIVRTALDAGKLNIPSAGGPVAIDGGRLTLGPVTALAQGADVAFTGSYDLGAEALDLKVGLTGAPRPDAPNGQRPELSVAIKGTLDAPRRSVDVAALINWLALRRVEQESKRLEAAEQDAKRVQAQAAEALRRAREAQSAEQAAPQAPAPTPPAATTTAERAPDLGPLIDIKSWLTGSTNKPRRPAPPDHPPAAAHKPAPPLAITPSGAQ